ncbi:hypothetical protein Ait01nite_015780 [Actinoplanes italicus]|uniref:Uncharacterized protein DUF3618 n=1 Tax=Actinoplanes italicus TaxID=113567 RepID=A0A2T0KHU5_9ACTN|nr:DUF3618 domain-containing protein [Actinoplanes italicus]PRX23013.1 uncharacterized protein DUF3618 [Actinoplanes italicus]GIE28533.1 hypothetical protein Ait01nite_015780 [Actinoplanes italicus]
MTSNSTPAGQERLTSEIRQTRADLGATVEALAAKTDVKTRAKQAVSDTAAQARDRVSAATTSTARLAGSTKERLAEAGRRPTTRRALPPAAIALAAAVGATIVVVRRRRAAARRVSSGPAAWLRRFR